MRPGRSGIVRAASALVLAGAVLALVSLQAVAAPAAAPGSTRICGQIKHGPHAKYLSLVSGIKSDGTTWTVIATGVPCKTALAKTPGLLKRWPKATIGARLPLAGYTCLKMADSAYTGSGQSSGGFLCHRGAGSPTSVFGPNTFTARGTDPYTIPQIKAFFGIK
jgi:hypothetical protein